MEESRQTTARDRWEREFVRFMEESPGALCICRKFVSPAELNNLDCRNRFLSLRGEESDFDIEQLSAFVTHFVLRAILDRLRIWGEDLSRAESEGNRKTVEKFTRLYERVRNLRERFEPELLDIVVERISWERFTQDGIIQEESQ